MINPAGEGRRLHWYSWGAPGQIADLARMPAIAEAHGVRVDPQRIYAIGGSMGGQETLLLAALHPHLLAGAAAFDPATDMRAALLRLRRAAGRAQLQPLARKEVGGTPAQVPGAYARRSPDHYVAAARGLGRAAAALLEHARPCDRRPARGDRRSRDGDPRATVPTSASGTSSGEWAHTAEMRATRRLPRALARFGLLPWQDVPPLPPPGHARAGAARLTSAASRSASRSSADSIPTESRTRFARRRERRAGGRGVRHARGMLDQALDAAERLGELEELRARDELDGLLLGVGQERDHAAEVAHLRARDVVARVAGRPG